MRATESKDRRSQHCGESSKPGNRQQSYGDCFALGDLWVVVLKLLELILFLDRDMPSHFSLSCIIIYITYIIVDSKPLQKRHDASQTGIYSKSLFLEARTHSIA